MLRRSPILLLTLVALALLAPLAQPRPAAAEPRYGYLWSLQLDFEGSFDGLLTIRVGPWKNGDLVSVDAISETKVPCRRVGSVYLDGGDAVFDGGYLSCRIDLGAIVYANHGLRISEIDSYGSMLVQTKLQASSNSVVPIFSHPDASYQLDFSQTSSVALHQELWNNAGPQQAGFASVIGASWQSYTYRYECISNGGPCDASFVVNTQQQAMPTAGAHIRFSTGPNDFLIGGDGVSSFSGRMGDILIDPGNTVH
jgi:hypothetical protein